MKPELLRLIDGLRSSPRGLEASALIREIEKHGLAVTEEDIREIVSRRDGGGFILPKRVIEFVMQLASGRKISTALDFGCGVVGFVGKALEQQKAGVTALTQVSECAALSQLLCKGTKVDVVCDNPLAWLGKTKLRFDFVFGAPPFGLKAELHLPLQGTSSKRNVDSVTAHMVWAGSRLTDYGVGIFVVPTSFAENQSNRTVETLSDCGLSLIAYLSLPPGIFLPHTSVAGALAVIARSGTGHVFVGTWRVSSNDSSQRILTRQRPVGIRAKIIGTRCRWTHLTRTGGLWNLGAHHGETFQKESGASEWGRATKGTGLQYLLHTRSRGDSSSDRKPRGFLAPEN